MRSQIRRKLPEIPLQSGVACPPLELYCFLKNPEEFESNSHWYTVSDNSVSCYVVGKREKLDLCVPSALVLLWWFTVTGVRWVYARAPECGGILIPPRGATAARILIGPSSNVIGSTWVSSIRGWNFDLYFFATALFKSQSWLTSLGFISCFNQIERRLILYKIVI